MYKILLEQLKRKGVLFLLVRTARNSPHFVFSSHGADHINHFDQSEATELLTEYGVRLCKTSTALCSTPTYIQVQVLLLQDNLTILVAYLICSCSSQKIRRVW